MNMSKRILFVMASIALFGGGIFFRAANTHSARIQADKIVQEDTASSSTAVDIGLLKDFVKVHMGSSVSFTLKTSYDKAAAAATAAANASGGSSQVYADAQKACSGKSDSITQAKCNQQYLATHITAAPPPVAVPAPVLADYQYKLSAPLWTPDLAGALLLGGLVSLGFALPPSRKPRHR